MNRTLTTMISTLVWSALLLGTGFGAGWLWRGDRAETVEATSQAAAATSAVESVTRARAAEAAQASATQQATDVADQREEQIDADYQQRMADVLAGRDGELGRLREHWAGCETSRLAEGAAAVAAAAEQDRSRRGSAARIVRAVELAQSERDEAIDLYQAVEASINGAELP